MSSNNIESISPSMTPITQSLQQSNEVEIKTDVHNLAVASAMAMINQFKKMEHNSINSINSTNTENVQSSKNN